jgi:hypothetical protein
MNFVGHVTEGSEGDASKGGLRFRCKTRHKDVCLFMKKNHEEFMEDAKLRQSLQQCDTQKVEGCQRSPQGRPCGGRQKKIL